MREMAEPREVAKNFYLGTLLVCIVGGLLMFLRAVVEYDWNHLAGVSVVGPLAFVISVPVMVAAGGYVRQHRLVRWVATHVPSGTAATVASFGSLRGIRKFLHQTRVLPAVHACTPDSIIRISAMLSPAEYVDARSLELVQTFEKVTEAPTLTSARIWGFMVRVRTHQADGICVYRAESGAGIVAYVETGKSLADANDFWKVTSSVEEALTIAERASGSARTPSAMNEIQP